MLAADAVDFSQLPGAQGLRRIEAPDALHQSLPPQNFVAAGDAAVKIIGDVEEGAVAVGDARIERQEGGREAVLAARGAAHLELPDRARRPYRPMPEQATANMDAGGNALVAQVERQR